MILHLGGDAVVSLKDIIAIFDIESVEYGSVNNEFIQISRHEGKILNISDYPPKSLILARNRNETILYLSPISTSTLMKRSSSPIDTSISTLNNKGETR